ncbi:MAG TPA: hypothetical protein VEA99_05745 [Gemmatimonadaceae bacterium]|nr:hypothetical protein [Gemmatimonadaceae bacterium]
MHEGVGGAGVQAPRTRPAPVRRERLVGREVEVHHEGAQEEEGAERRVHEVRVLAEPAEPRAAREVALEQGPRVDVRLASHRVPHARLDPPVQRAQPLDHDVVVVVAARVAGDRSRRLASAVLHGDDERARHALERQPRVAPPVGPAGEIVHLARVSRLEPRVEGIRRLHGPEGRDADEIEPEPERLRLGEAGERGEIRGGDGVGGHPG